MLRAENVAMMTFYDGLQTYTIMVTEMFKDYFREDSAKMSSWSVFAGSKIIKIKIFK